ncbi:MAG: hypothetical protein ACI311_06830 [Bacilli bacterium]
MKKIFRALLCIAALTLSIPTTSCSSFFGTGEEVVITSFTTTTDDFGNTVVTIEFEDGSEPLTFTIPASQTGLGIASIIKSTDNGDTIYTISYVDELEPTIIRVPASTGVVTGITSLENEDGSLTVTISLKEGDPITFVVPSVSTYVSIASVNVDESSSATVITISYTNHAMEDTVISIPKVKGIKYILTDETDTNYIITFKFSDNSEQKITLTKPQTPNTWLSDYGVPSMSLGNVGDFYYDKNSSTIYQKVSAVRWEIVTILKSEDTVYTVTFDANGGNFNAGTVASIQSVVKGDTFYNSQNSNSFPSVYYEKEDGTQKTFLGWYTSQDQNDVNATHFTDLTPVMCDITLYAWWSE